jgi:Zn-dependent protease with chaperone function
MSFGADYFDGATSRRRPVLVEAADGTLRVRGVDVSFDVALARIRVGSPVGRAPRRLELPDGGVLVTADAAAVAVLGSPAAGIAHRLESHPVVVLAALVLLPLLGWAAWRGALPWIARAVAQRLPPSIEAEFGREGLRVLDESLFEPSRLPFARRRAVGEHFDRLRDLASPAVTARLEFRRATWIGPNAFALPGGLVVVTDELVEGLRDDERVVAILAHELGHVAHRHGLRHLLQHSAIAIVTFTVLGDAGTSFAAAFLPMTLASAAYSRTFEREADLFAFDVLRRSGRSPTLFADALRALDPLAEEGGRAPSRRVLDYLSSHPSSDDRIRAAQAADGGP